MWSWSAILSLSVSRKSWEVREIFGLAQSSGGIIWRLCSSLTISSFSMPSGTVIPFSSANFLNWETCLRSNTFTSEGSFVLQLEKSA